MVMKGKQILPVLGRLNTEFSAHRIQETTKWAKHFAPGEPLGQAIANLVAEGGTEVHKLVKQYVEMWPAGLQETIRANIYYALNTTPPTLMTFAWTPSYDYEVNVWHIDEPPPAASGITIQLKSRYPDDEHPLASALVLQETDEPGPERSAV